MFVAVSRDKFRKNRLHYFKSFRHPLPAGRRDSAACVDMAKNHAGYMQVAYEEAMKGRAEGGVPVGAVLVASDGAVIGRGHNKRVQEGSVIKHGEMDCLENAGRLKAKVYQECTMYTTLSPCAMCTGAIIHYKIPRVVIGENVNSKGPESQLRAHGVAVDVLDDVKCIEMMRTFIASEPELWNEDIAQ